MVKKENENLSFRKSELTSVELVRKMREEEFGRYKEEIGDALDELSKKPKSEWPELFKDN
ncbi:hypothetical protein AKJ56_02280 [candidate division MSBL1 archaeon SCGC-AAA382N08]|uniref:Uncharacterized protein n=1 Tax=candidate division MSBL1 archaeon SCGC-AAA382N08 TaxID=1698285 RepID=A0A133VMY2_9EURY|nr:hypothetical protein AKJ56_02280 [candidate division MSBL1 archaeon SCGC-AAA382N08]